METSIKTVSKSPRMSTVLIVSSPLAPITLFALPVSFQLLNVFYPLLYQGEKARRKGSVNAVPLTPTQTSMVPVAAEAFLENIEVCIMDDPEIIASSFKL